MPLLTRMVNKLTCAHHWICGQPHLEGNKRITHEHCRLCGVQRDLVEEITRQKYKYKTSKENKFREVVKRYHTELKGGVYV